MKHFFYIPAAVLMAAQLQSCSDDDDVQNISQLEKDYFSIENAEYVAGNMPEATTSQILNGIDMSTQVMNGAMNYVTIVTEQKVYKFFVGVKNLDGYWEYVPNIAEASPNQGVNTYVIPVMISQSYRGNSTMVLSGQLEDGTITAPVENEISYIETMPGAIEIKLAFSNSKDIDLHLYTPSGEHIYYGNRGGIYTDEDGNEISYGLDVDSNAACHIDNINKENIYIPAELVEDGTYTVKVNMYENCRSSIATSWSIVARYQGELITPVTGSNPASGIYPEGARDGDHTEVMTFTISNGSNVRSGSASSIKSTWTFTPTPLTESDKIKMDFISE